MITWDIARRYLALGIAAIALCRSASPQNALNVTVCQLKEHSSDFNGKYVRVKAIYLTDLRHFAFLKDPACPEYLIDADEMLERQGDPSVKKFVNAVSSSPLNGSLTFAVDVSGRFRLKEDEVPGLLSGVAKAGSHGVLVLKRVWSYRRIRESD